MSRMEVIPAGASAVVEVGEKHDEAIDKITLREALANQREAGAARERDAAASALAAAHGVDETKDARRDIEGFVTTGFTAGALAAANTDERLDDKTASIVHAVSHGIERADSHYAGLSSRVDAGFSAQNTAQQVGFSAATVQAATLAGQASVQATSNFNLTSVQAQDIGNRASVERTAFSYQAQLLAQTNQSALILQGQQLAAAQAAASAKCCCENEKLQLETRTLIVAENQKTRDLILSEKAMDGRFKTLALENAYNVLAGRVTPPVPPVV